MPPKPISRRRFISQFNCAAIGSSAILNTLVNLKLANSAAADGLNPGTDSKALVCVFLNGGMDSFQALVPRETSRYASYAASRGPAGSDGGLALPRESLLALDGTAADFGFHPSMVAMHQMATGTGAFAGKRRVAAITNVGTLVDTISKAQYKDWAGGRNAALPIPRALFSHSDQIEQWQTAIPQGALELTGWAGRAADIIHSAYNSGSTSMSITLSGNNVLQVGSTTTQFAVSSGGAQSFESYSPAHLLKNQALRSTLDQTYSNLLTQSLANLTRDGDGAQLLFQDQFNSTASDLGAANALFPANNSLASNLRAVLKTIKIRAALGLRRQTFFISAGGWDMHGDLLGPQATLLGSVDAALGAFQQGLEILGLADDVVTFTASDFARTLRSNGRGTDHAWGANAFVMGGPVDGGKVFGTYPDLTIDGPDDVGYGGRLLPTTSADLYFAELLRWFGVPATEMATVLPNIANFWNPLSGTAPLGFVKS